MISSKYLTRIDKYRYQYTGGYMTLSRLSAHVYKKLPSPETGKGRKPQDHLCPFGAFSHAYSIASLWPVSTLPDLLTLLLVKWIHS